MAYFVGKTLRTRPFEIMTKWSCEELLVAFAFYANQQSSEYYDSLSKKERHQKKMTPLDRWAVPFVSEEQLRQLNAQDKQEQAQLDDMATIAEAMFG